MVIASLQHAARNLLRSRNRTVVAVLTVASGIVAFLLAGGFIAWIFHDMREATIHSQLGHLQIVRPGYFDKGIADPYSYLLAARPPELEALEKMQGVKSVTPRLGFSGLASFGEATIPFVGEGVDPERERPISKRVVIQAGRDLGSVEAREAILGEGLAKSLGIRLGDDIVLMANAANGSASAVEVKVVGTFATIYKEYDDQALRLPIAQARKLMRVEGATSWVVLFDSTDATEAHVAALRGLLPAKDYELIPWNALADFYNKTVSLFSKQVNVMKVIIGLIIVLTISNTQMMSVFERTTEIGTSLAIGLRRAAILRMFIIEGVMIGIAGGLAGALFGYLLAEAISAVGIPMPPPPGMAHGYVASILVTPDLLVDAAVLALLTTLLASLMPAWRASRLDIVDALRTNQ